MNKTILIGLSLAIGAGIIMINPITVNASSDTDVVFEHIMAIDIHEESTVVYSSTDIPVVCKIEYAKTVDGFSEPLVVTHNSSPHTGHIVKIPELMPNTEYEYRFTAQIDEQEIYSEEKSFTTIE